LVTGVDEKQQIVLVNDPARRKLLPISRSDFEKSWDATNRWTLLAVPEGTEGPAEPAPLPSPVVSDLSKPEGDSDPFLEEASTAFRSGDLASAKRLSRKSSDSSLTNEFLATIFFLEDNLDAAIKYWNRNGAPRLRDVRMDFQSRSDPVLLDHTVGISRATVLRNADYRLARKRLEATGAFSKFTFDLSPAGESEYDLSLRAAERSTWNPSTRSPALRTWPTSFGACCARPAWREARTASAAPSPAPDGAQSAQRSRPNWISLRSPGGPLSSAMQRPRFTMRSAAAPVRC
jgi:hypothetical protein